MTTAQLDAFTELTSRWLAHQDLRAGDAPIAKLAASRETLDAARVRAVRAVRATGNR